MRRMHLVAGVLAIALAAAPLPAQTVSPAPGQHQGFWIGFGLGGGTNLADFADGARAGLGAYLRLGGTVSQKLLLGGEIIGWGRSINGATLSESGLTGVALFYPQGKGFFLKAGAGFAGWATSAPAGGGTTTQTAGGFAGTLGVGYELQVGGNLYLTPNFDFLYHTMESGNTAFADISSGQVLLFTLGLTWH
jgi:hypothetical protein